MTLIFATLLTRDSDYEREVDCATLAEAIRLADGCIEDGGHADVSVWVEPGEPVPDVPAYALCDIHITQGEEGAL